MACGTGAWRLLPCVRMLTEPQVEGGSARRCVPCFDMYLTPAHISPEEVGLLAKRLAASKDPKEAARLRQRITRGFYGI